MVHKTSHLVILISYYSPSLQRVKDELQMRRQHLDSISIEGEDEGLNFVKPLDHEKFYTVIGAWRLTSGNSNLELQIISPRDEEHHKHHHCCNGQHQQEVLVNSVYEEEFNSPET